MQTQLYELSSKNEFYRHFCMKENQRIRSTMGMLCKTLTKYQKKLLLRIIDDKDIVIEKTAHDSYANGFRTAAKIMIESLYFEDTK